MKSNVKEDCLIIVFIIERSPHCLQKFTLLAVGKKRFCWNVNEHQFKYNANCCNCVNVTVLSKGNSFSQQSYKNDTKNKQTENRYLVLIQMHKTFSNSSMDNPHFTN